MDDKLIKAIDGDRSALIDLLCTLGPQLRAELRPKISEHYKSSFDEDDVLSVTYCEAIRSFSTFTPNSNPDCFLHWLRRIALNNIRDAVKALNRHSRIPPFKLRAVQAVGDQSFVCLLRELTEDSPTPSVVFQQDEARQIIELALSKLPTDYQKVIHFYELEQRPVQEVAELMKRSEGAIYMLRARALDSLRQIVPPLSQVWHPHE